jgi:hypothetical protein
VRGHGASCEPTSPARPPSAVSGGGESVNCYITLGARQCQVPLRDTDEGRLLERLEAELQRFPVPAAPAAPTIPAPVVDDAALCRKHGVVMKLNHGMDGRTWYSHKTAEGWCKGKYPPTRQGCTALPHGTRGATVRSSGSTGAPGRCTMVPARWSVSVCIRRVPKK